MQLTSNNTTLSPQVQSILPVLKNLNINERLSVISFLAGELQADTTLSQIQEPSIAQKRYGKYRGQIKILDGFDDEFGDEFWFGKDA